VALEREPPLGANIHRSITILFLFFLHVMFITLHITFVARRVYTLRTSCLLQVMFITLHITFVARRVYTLRTSCLLQVMFIILHIMFVACDEVSESVSLLVVVAVRAW
jgi:hypothetical protein